MKIIRIYNNNIIAALDGDKEVILTGNGIGFKKKANDEVDPQKIDKTYTFEDQQKTQFQQLLNRTPILYFQIAESIASRAVKQLNIELSNQILISLTDHLWYAVERKKKNLQMPNLMLNEIKVLYKNEYKVGLWAIKLIQANTQIELGENEASYIAMHIVNATLGSGKETATKILRFVKDVQTVIENTFDISFDEDVLDFSRLLTHLKFLAQHIFSNEEKEPMNMDQMYSLLISNHERMERCIDNITEIVNMNYRYQLTQDEKVYLLIHINKIMNKNETPENR
ncbi:PRD domain-containing protein [Breznakia pachnodae]|uniref:Beta-glucoside operon transcriptional antiterminator n=1 Tax=Breznakia pachnodae TaxID=265178 RepID=A0ABU0E6U8_9FIRM|nr:PRD domain-containing protein [Breznakia pachnodae]MDQ0362628.1 beta-glucoside operon transcriptional antiterminator [Breznakia pachnodae]